MKIENTVINQNDNAEFLGAVYLGTDEYGDKSRRLQWRDTALRLIDKHLPAYRRSREPEWQHMEAFIVEMIDQAYQAHLKRGRTSSIAFNIESISIFLGAQRIKVYNDPDLPEFMQGYPFLENWIE